MHYFQTVRPFKFGGVVLHALDKEGNNPAGCTWLWVKLLRNVHNGRDIENWEVACKSIENKGQSREDKMKTKEKVCTTGYTSGDCSTVQIL